MLDRITTYGESRFAHLMRQLPPDEFYCYEEPRINSVTTTSRYPDFLIVWRSKGVICVEVKDWSGDIVGGDKEIIKVKINDEIKHMKNPYEIARGYKERVMETLIERSELQINYRGSIRLGFPIDPLVVMTGRSKVEISGLISHGIFDEDTVLSGDDLATVDDFMAALNRMPWTFWMPQPLTHRHVSLIEQTLSLTEVRAEERSSGPRTLTIQQENIVTAPISNARNGLTTTLIRGTFGSGKTIVLSKKAEYLAQPPPDLQILVTTFNKDLTHDLKDRIQNTRVQVEQIFDLVRTILGDQYPQTNMYRGKPDPKPIKEWCKEHHDQLELPVDFVAQEISRRKDLELDTDARYLEDLQWRGSDLSQNEVDELTLTYHLYMDYQAELKASGEDWQDYEDTIKMAMSAVHGHKYRRYFDLIMVDEGQDFTPNMLELLRSMVRPGGDLIIFEDPLQSLWKEFNIPSRGLGKARLRFLSTPLRSTQQIAEAAQSLLDIIPAMKTHDDDGIDQLYPAKTDGLQPGHKPFLSQYPDSETEQEHLISFVKQYQQAHPDQTIGVLTPDFMRDWHDLFTELGVYYGHFNFAKGLEFDTVCIARLDTLFHSPWNQRKIMRRWLYRKWFVAMTRARSNLYLSYTGSLRENLDSFRYYCQTADVHALPPLLS